QMNSNSVSMDHAKMVSIRCMDANLVPFLKGSPGVGKSSLVKSIADQYDLVVIDLRLAQCEPTDLLGFPHINKDTGRASYVPMDSFPLEGDPIPDGKRGWLLFLDEFNSADRDVQKAAYKLVLDRQVGQHNLHPQVAIIAAGNLETDNAIVEELSSALKSRITHMETHVSADEWLTWAVEAGLDYRVTSFINWKPDMIHKFNPDSSSETYPCPRTWEFASRLLSRSEKMDDITRSALKGTIGEGAAIELIAFAKISANLPDFNQLLQNPEGFPIPEEPSHIYALCGSIGSRATGENIGKLMPYINRMPAEFQVVTLREVLGRNKDMVAGGIIKDPAVQAWIVEKAQKYFS
ncbi:MAG: AAA family ATPase, partial [Pseudomonadota bacterium]